MFNMTLCPGFVKNLISKKVLTNKKVCDILKSQRKDKEINKNEICKNSDLFTDENANSKAPFWKMVLGY